MTLKDKQRKLQKLLALSASPNEAEAISAMEKCNALMDSWGIRTIDVNIETNETNIATESIFGYKRYTAWEAHLASVIAEAFDIEVVIQKRKINWNVMFIAGASEIEIVSDLYIKLRRIISKSGKEYCKNNKGHWASLQKSYAFGISDTIAKRLKTLYSNTPSTSALVLVKREAIDAFLFNKFGRIKCSKVTAPTNRNAYMKGMEDGKHVNINKSVHCTTPESVSM